MIRFALIGKPLLNLGRKATNVHQLAMKSGISYPTVDRYINHPLKTQAYDSYALASILIEGLGMTREQILEMKVGDLFDLVEVNKAEEDA